MKLTVISVWLAVATAALAAPKVAIVRVTDIYRNLPSTKAMQEKFVGENDAIVKNERAVQLEKIVEVLQSMKAELVSRRNEAENPEVQKLARDYEIKRQEAQALRQEFEEFNTTEKKRINKELVETMRESLDRITAASRKLAEERNLDMVFDTSGDSNTGVPLMLYSGDAPDLTDDVIALLDEKALDDDASETEASAESENGE